MNDIIAIKTIGTIVTMWGITNSVFSILTIINTHNDKNSRDFWIQYVSSISLFSLIYGCTYSLMKKL